MTKILFRLLLVAVLFINIAIMALSAVTGVNIYENYGRQISLGIIIFCVLICAFYISLGLLGIS